MLQIEKKVSKRITSIDLHRVIVIIIMALDHVRDYFHAGNFQYEPNDLSQTTTAVFFTRWISHFCAPIFVFLAGTSAFLVGERKTKKELAAFLLKRGLWLMLLEVVVISFAWTFNPAYIIFRLQVIWVLGLSMVCMSALIYLPPKIILIVGLMILFGHNLLDYIHATGNTFKDFLWAQFHERKRFYIAGHQVTTGYSILAWLGIMMLGYSFGMLYKKGMDAAVRKKYLLLIGSIAIMLFVILRAINSYGDMAPWATQPSFVLSVCSFFNVTKYPPSVMYTLMTLGPALITLSLLEKPLNWWEKIIIPFGRVPLFFYILHLFLIYGLAVVAVVASGRPWTDMIITTLANAKESPWQKGYGFSLGGTYAVWVLVVLLLLPLCRWYDKYNTNHKEKWWLSYL